MPDTSFIERLNALNRTSAALAGTLLPGGAAVIPLPIRARYIVTTPRVAVNNGPAMRAGLKLNA